MLKFEEFTQAKKCEEFTHRLTKATEGYADCAQIGVVDDHQIFKVIINPEGERTVAFVAGLHGDEPGGPMGVLKFLENKPPIPKRKRVVIIPLANPTGYMRNTRKNKDDVDLNRKFLEEEMPEECQAVWKGLEDEDLTVLHTLHEDPDQDGFYLYYTHNKPLAEELKELARKYFKVYKDGEMYGDKMVEGLIPLPHIVRGGVEDRVFTKHGIPYITTETPGKAPLSRRSEYTFQAMKRTIHSI